MPDTVENQPNPAAPPLGPPADPAVPDAATPDAATPAPVGGSTAAPQTQATVPSEPAESPALRSLGRSLGLRTVVAGAVVTAVISSILNPDFISRAWRAVTGDDGEPRVASTVRLEPKSDSRLSITVKAPATWGTAKNRHNIFGPDTPGDAMATGVNPTSGWTMATSRLYVAASHDGVRRLHITASTDPGPALLTQLRKDVGWPSSGCRLAGEEAFPHDTITGPMREWSGCSGFGDATMWEGWLVTSDSATLVYVQFNIRAADLDHDTAVEMMRSIVIDPDRLSG